MHLILLHKPCIFAKAKVNVLVVHLCPTLCNLMTVAHQAPLCMEFSRQEYWSGLPFPSPGDHPDPGIEPGFPALGRFFTV